jgi:hypothetical protein
MSYAIISVIFGSPCLDPESCAEYMDSDGIPNEVIDQFLDSTSDLKFHTLYSAGGDITPCYIGFELFELKHYESESWEDLNLKITKEIAKLDQNKVTEFRNKVSKLSSDEKKRLEIRDIGVYTIWSDS